MNELLIEKALAEKDLINLFQHFFSACSEAGKKVGGTTDIYLLVADQNVCLKFLWSK